MAMIEINLLPKEFRRKGGLGLPKAALAGIIGLGTLVLLLAGATYYQKLRLAHVQDEIARVEAKAQRMRKDIEMVDRLVDVKTRIARRLSAIERLDRNRSVWVQNIEDLAIVIPEFLWLSEFQQGDGNAGRKTKAGPAPLNVDSINATRNDLTLEGYCFTVSSLANLILNLQDSPRFSNIQLRRARLTKLNDRRVYDFQVVCRLEPIDVNVEGLDDVPAASDKLGKKGLDEGELFSAAYPEGD